MLLASNLRRNRVAWYPSAGTDFRPLLYLHPDFQSQCNVPKPDVYLFSDCLDYPGEKLLEHGVLFEDTRTRLTALSVEFIGVLNLSVRPELVHFSNPHPLRNHVYKINVQIESTELSPSTATVYYAFCENTALANYLIRHRIRVSHLIRVCYVNAMGGSAASGVWLMNATEALRTEFLISDKNADWYTESTNWREADDFAVQHFRGIPSHPHAQLDLMDIKMWGGSNTFWYKVSSNSTDDYVLPYAKINYRMGVPQPQGTIGNLK